MQETAIFRSRLIGVCRFAASLGILAAWAWAAGATAADFDPTSLVGARVDINFFSGESYGNVEVTAVARGSEAGTVRSVTIVHPLSDKPTVVGAVRIRDIASPAGGPWLVFDRKLQILAPPKKLADDEKAAAVPGQWPKLTNEQQKAAVEQQRKFLDTVKQGIPNHTFYCLETSRIIFITDLPRQAVLAQVLPKLNVVYGKLCSAFSIDPSTNVFMGKAIVVAFADPNSYPQFEMALYRLPAGSSEARCHMIPATGLVQVNCFWAGDPKHFVAVMIHELTHGFTFRYRSDKMPPLWLNEGISEWIANQVVGGESSIRTKVSLALDQMKKKGNMDGFYSGKNFGAIHYGAATCMVDYLLKYSPEPARPGGKIRHLKPEEMPFRKLIDGIKDGVPWEESLKKAYDLTPEELAKRYGATIGVPNLRM